MVCLADETLTFTSQVTSCLPHICIQLLREQSLFSTHLAERNVTDGDQIWPLLSKFPGFDRIRPSLSRMLKRIIFQPSTFLYCFFLSFGRIPNDMRWAVATLLLKTDFSVEASNYRSTFLSLISCKVIERIVSSSIFCMMLNMLIGALSFLIMASDIPDGHQLFCWLFADDIKMLAYS